MAVYDQAVQAKRRARALELLRQGLTTRQISERLGMTQRAALRLKKKLEDARVQGNTREGASSERPQGAAAT